MLLPNKHVSVSRSLVGVGALILWHLEGPLTVSGLWDQIKHYPGSGEFS